MFFHAGTLSPTRSRCKITASEVGAVVLRTRIRFLMKSDIVDCVPQFARHVSLGRYVRASVCGPAGELSGNRRTAEGRTNSCSVAQSLSAGRVALKRQLPSLCRG